MNCDIPIEYDLHVHTSASDGTLSPEEVLRRAARVGLKGIAITDHDTVAGLKPAREFLASSALPVELVPGIELNTEAGASEVHILGYFIDDNNPTLLTRLKNIRESRRGRAREMIKKLCDLGFDISYDQVDSLAGGDLIGRPHIARALIEKGYVSSVKEAFQKYIGKGRPAFVPRYKFLPEEAIDLIRTSGGISFLAHPGLIAETKWIGQVIAYGINGLEVYYPEHHPDQVRGYLELAQKHELLVSGGSDFHGEGASEGRERLGYAGISQQIYCKIRSRLPGKEEK